VFNLEKREKGGKRSTRKRGGEERESKEKKKNVRSTENTQGRGQGHPPQTLKYSPPFMPRTSPSSPSTCPARVGYLPACLSVCVSVCLSSLPFFPFLRLPFLPPAFFPQPFTAPRTCSVLRRGKEERQNERARELSRGTKGTAAWNICHLAEPTPIEISSSTPFPLANNAKLYTHFVLVMSCMLLAGQVILCKYDHHTKLNWHLQNRLSPSHSLTKQEKKQTWFLFRALLYWIFGIRSILLPFTSSRTHFASKT
jgi:hypothetical protein